MLEPAIAPPPDAWQEPYDPEAFPDGARRDTIRGHTGI